MECTLRKNRRSGFTLVEMMVSLGIMAVLSGVMLGYSRVSERQVALISDRDKVVSIINHARNLALSRSYVSGQQICGYGIKFSATKMEIYSSVKVAGVCDPTAPVSGTFVETQLLDPRLTFATKPNYIFFTSPYITVASTVPFPVTITLSAQSADPMSLRISSCGAVSY